MTTARREPGRVVVIGAGIGGLASALRLAHAGCDVTVLERHAGPGGKMRTLPSPAGPVDTGPTVLTLRAVFDDLYRDVGEDLDHHLTLVRQHILARHFWPDGSALDLYDSAEASAGAIGAFAGQRAATQFLDFDRRARALFSAFDRPVMQAARPGRLGVAAAVAAKPSLIADMAPLSVLSQMLESSFDEPRLRQLFGRYATYVGGLPHRVPALLALIWEAEAAGVWAIEGGMGRLAASLAGLIAARGGRLRYHADVARIEVDGGRVIGVILADGDSLPAETVLFNGDPRALATGALGPGTAGVARQTATLPRSLSADVWAFAARPDGPRAADLSHHNVFFRRDAEAEFLALERGERSESPTLYLCAMDRGLGRPPPAVERFEIIANAPALGTSGSTAPGEEEYSRCQTRTFRTLEAFGLRFDPTPGPAALTTPSGFEALFPATAGALYGQAPEGLTAAFRRPVTTTPVKGLYLAGGGPHPGAGVPMAALSARAAAAAILGIPISPSTFRRTATPGGMSTASTKTPPAPSASSGS